jgi:hypothetical protein
MYQPLVPCDSCARHVRVADERCPFCGGAVSDAMRAITPPPLPSLQLSRAGFLALAAAMTLAGCKEDAPTIAKDPPKTKTSASATQADPAPAQDAGLVDDHGGVMAKYGGPPTFKPPSPSTSVSTPIPPPAMVPAYGAPPPMPPAPKPT